MRIQHPGDIDLLSKSKTEPAFRVAIFTPVPDKDAWVEELWDLHDTDVKEAITWADSNLAPGQRYTMYIALTEEHAGTNLMWLCGKDPNDYDPGDGVFTEVFPDHDQN